MWEPWVGRDYYRQRCLLLGESHRGWLNGERGDLAYPPADAPSCAVHFAQRRPLDGRPSMVRLTRALCNCDNPTAEQATNAWNSVAFTFYLPVTSDSVHGRATRAASWRDAAQEWSRLLELLRPRLVLVLGLRLWGMMPQTKSIISAVDHGYELDNGLTALCHAVQSPAGAHSWTAYADVLAKATRFAA